MYKFKFISTNKYNIQITKLFLNRIWNYSLFFKIYIETRNARGVGFPSRFLLKITLIYVLYLQERKWNSYLHVFEFRTKTNHMVRVHWNEQTSWHVLALYSGNLVLFVFDDQQSIPLRIVKYLVSRHTWVYTGRIGCYRWRKTNVRND